MGCGREELDMRLRGLLWVWPQIFLFILWGHHHHPNNHIQIFQPWPSQPSHPYTSPPITHSVPSHPHHSSKPNPTPPNNMTQTPWFYQHPTKQYLLLQPPLPPFTNQHCIFINVKLITHSQEFPSHNSQKPSPLFTIINPPPFIRFLKKQYSHGPCWGSRVEY